MKEGKRLLGKLNGNKDSMSGGRGREKRKIKRKYLRHVMCMYQHTTIIIVMYRNNVLKKKNTSLPLYLSTFLVGEAK